MTTVEPGTMKWAWYYPSEASWLHLLWVAILPLLSCCLISWAFAAFGYQEQPNVLVSRLRGTMRRFVWLPTILGGLVVQYQVQWAWRTGSWLALIETGSWFVFSWHQKESEVLPKAMERFWNYRPYQASVRLYLFLSVGVICTVCLVKYRMFSASQHQRHLNRRIVHLVFKPEQKPKTFSFYDLRRYVIDSFMRSLRHADNESVEALRQDLLKFSDRIISCLFEMTVVVEDEDDEDVEEMQPARSGEEEQRSQFGEVEQPDRSGEEEQLGQSREAEQLARSGFGDVRIRTDVMTLSLIQADSVVQAENGLELDSTQMACLQHILNVQRYGMIHAVWYSNNHLISHRRQFLKVETAVKSLVQTLASVNRLCKDETRSTLLTILATPRRQYESALDQVHFGMIWMAESPISWSSSVFQHLSFFAGGPWLVLGAVVGLFQPNILSFHQSGVIIYLETSYKLLEGWQPNPGMYPQAVHDHHHDYMEVCMILLNRAYRFIHAHTKAAETACQYIKKFPSSHRDTRLAFHRCAVQMYIEAKQFNKAVEAAEALRVFLEEQRIEGTSLWECLVEVARGLEQCAPMEALKVLENVIPWKSCGETEGEFSMEVVKSWASGPLQRQLWAGVCLMLPIYCRLNYLNDAIKLVRWFDPIAESLKEDNRHYWKVWGTEKKIFSTSIGAVDGAVLQRFTPVDDEDLEEDQGNVNTLEARTSLDKALQCQSAGEFEEAIEYHNKWEIKFGIDATTTNVPSVCTSPTGSITLLIPEFYYQRGFCYYQLNKNEEALRDLEEGVKTAKRYFRRDPDRWAWERRKLTALNYAMQARCLVRMGRVEGTQDLFNQAIFLINAEELFEMVVDLHKSREIKEALKHLNEWEIIFGMGPATEITPFDSSSPTKSIKNLIPRVYSQRGCCYLHLEKYEEALCDFEKGVETAKKYFGCDSDRWDFAEKDYHILTYTMEAVCLTRLERDEEAQDRFSKAKSLVAEYSVGFGTLDEVKSLELMLILKNATIIEEALEELRKQYLRCAATQRAIGSGLEDEWVNFSNNTNMRPTFMRTEYIHLLAGKELEAMIYAERTHSRFYMYGKDDSDFDLFDRDNEYAFCIIRQTVMRCDPNTAIIFYSYDGCLHGVYVAARVTRDGEVPELAYSGLPSKLGSVPEDIGKCVTDAREAITNAQKDPKSNLAQLYKLLLLPMVEKSFEEFPHSIDTLLFVPQGELSKIPFAALYDEQNGKHLIEKYCVGVIPGFRALHRCFEKQKSFEMNRLKLSKPFVAGNPEPMGCSKGSLPGAAEEAKGVAELLDVKPVVGKAMTKAAVVDGLQTSSFVLIATHGEMEKRNHSKGHLVMQSSSLPDEEILTGSEISKLNVQAGLVILSGCRTGDGKVTREGLLGLGRATLHGGATSAIVSLWKVGDLATKDLVIDVMREFCKGEEPVIKCLQLAMQRMITDGKSVNNWASLSLIGSPTLRWPFYKSDKTHRQADFWDASEYEQNIRGQGKFVIG